LSNRSQKYACDKLKEQKDLLNLHSKSSILRKMKDGYITAKLPGFRVGYFKVAHMNRSGSPKR
jgi:hypothetical protein